MSDPLIVERHGAVTVFRMNRPATRNALIAEIKARLATEVPAFVDDASSRCLLITGSEDVFCAGGDIRTMTGEQTPATVRERMAASHAWLLKLMTTDKPIVTAVNGAAAGAGLSLALAGDIVLVADDAYFLGGFAKVGVAPDFGVGWFLSRAVGPLRAKDILLANRKVTAAEAVAMGMASRVVPGAELFETALALAHQLADGPTPSLGMTKRLIDNAYRTPAEYLELEALAQVVAFGSAEFREGVDAFLNKRPPVFHG